MKSMNMLRVAMVVGLMSASVACSKQSDRSAPATRTAVTAATPTRPTFARRRAAIAQGKAALASGDWETCARHFELAQAWIDAARCATHTADLGRAFEDLSRGLTDLGPGKAAAVGPLRDDPDLKPLVREPRWLAVLGEAETQRTAYQGHQNAELAQLARGAEPAEEPPVAPRLPDPADAKLFAARVPRVAALLEASGAQTADDYFHAALVYYRADNPTDASRAHELALAGLERAQDSDELKWLAAAAEDRQLELESKPQKFGTQLVRRGAHYALWNVDPALSDAERDKWSVASLAESIANAEAGETGTL
ncbi:MAG TPA: hypothetical protein VGC42_01000 [Kofleriaceae bacterium]